MGYFGSAYGSNWSANAPSSNQMMFTPNAYGGYSTLAAGSRDYGQASQYLSNLRGMLSSPNSGRAAAEALVPWMQMSVSPVDAGQQMARTFGQAGLNMGNIMGQANQFVQQQMKKSQAQGQPSGQESGGGPMTFGGSGGSASQQNPLSYLGGIFGQYGGGMGGGSFGSGWGYR